MTVKHQVVIEPINDILTVTLLTVCCIMFSLLVLLYILPGNYFYSYPLIPVFFYGHALFFGFLAKKAKRKKSRGINILYLFLIAKGVKIVLSLLLLLGSILVYRKTAKFFCLTFMSFYIVFLIYDTWFFSKLKKKEIE